MLLKAGQERPPSGGSLLWVRPQRLMILCMVSLEIRRHAETSKAGSIPGTLSRAGLASALTLRAQAPAYALVVASPRLRTQNTARTIAGHVEDIEQVLDVASDEAITTDEYFSMASADAVAKFVRGRATAQAFVATQLALWSRLAARLIGNQRALIVTHGANVELPAVVLALELGARPPVVPVGYLQGLRVTYEGAIPQAIESLSESPIVAS